MKKKKFVNLDKKWKEILYAASGFGPNLLMVLMGAYFTDAMNPVALPEGSLQAITGTCLITPALFSVLWFIGKVFDGIIDVPFASITDNLKTKWGRRRIPIAICFVPMVVSYILCWIPISDNPIANTIWIFVWSLIFFATYTMNLIAFYGSLSSVCSDEAQRTRVSSFKAFFDTISYCLVYALVPLMLDGMGIHIDKLAFMMVPMMITMIIPIVMIKEGDKWEKKAIAAGFDITPLAEEEKVGLFQSIKMTFTNKLFMHWCLVNCCSFFGLQMFLVAMNAMITGGMGLNGTQMAILNTCAFAPVPLTLYLFNRVKAKRGVRFAYQSALLAFAVAIMLTFFVGNSFIAGDNTTLKMIFGVIGSLLGSWGIGAFFMMGYLVPAQISSVEEKLTKKNHSAMYFAAQAVTTTVVGAVASSLVYENIKNLFISKAEGGVVYASSLKEAAEIFNTSSATVFNFGTLIVPIIVCVFCVLGFFVAFKMPKNYTPKEVAKRLGLVKEYKENKDLFIEEVSIGNDEKSMIVNLGLWVLTGSIFGIVWRYETLKAVESFGKKISIVHFIVSIFVTPYSAAVIYQASKAIQAELKKNKINSRDLTILVTILAFLGLDVVSMTILQVKLNKIARKNAD